MNAIEMVEYVGWIFMLLSVTGIALAAIAREAKDVIAHQHGHDLAVQHLPRR